MSFVFAGGSKTLSPQYWHYIMHIHLSYSISFVLLPIKFDFLLFIYNCIYIHIMQFAGGTSIFVIKLRKSLPLHLKLNYKYPFAWNVCLFAEILQLADVFTW